MTFVQITFGSTINRQLRNIVSWATSELMVLRYVHTFRAAFWPNESSDGQVKISSGRDDKAKVSNSASNSEQGGCNRTDKDKLATRREIESALFPVSSDNRSCSSGCIPEVNIVTENRMLPIYDFYVTNNQNYASMMFNGFVGISTSSRTTSC